MLSHTVATPRHGVEWLIACAKRTSAASPEEEQEVEAVVAALQAFSRKSGKGKTGVCVCVCVCAVKIFKYDLTCRDEVTVRSD